MSQTNTDLATRQSSEMANASDFMPAMNIEQAISRYNLVVAFTKQIMKLGRDYGTIPGTEKKNKDGSLSSSTHTLLKPGAEKLCTLFGLAPRFEDYRVIEDWDKGLFYFGYRCILTRNGRPIAEGIGSANSREKKYRRESRLCPACEKPAIKKSKFPPKGSERGTPGGWYCDSKSGGCGAEFQHDDSAVLNRASAVDTDAAADQINTLQKMAQKRSLVAATLIATNASEFFTQDVEDAGGGGGEPTAGDFIEGELTDPLEDGETFLAEWDAVSKSHDLHPEIGRRIILSAKLKQAKVEFVAADLATRKKMLAEYKSATPEQIRQVKELEAKKTSGKNGNATAQTQPVNGEQPITPELVNDNKTFWTAAWQSADARGISSSVYADAIERADPKTPEQRTAILVAIRAGTFDWETGTVRRLEPVGA